MTCAPMPTIIEELVETNGYSYSGDAADAINIIISDVDIDFYHCLSTTVASQTLTIVYTAAAAGVAPTGVLDGPLVGPLGGPI